jgi:hypothetical protein
MRHTNAVTLLALGLATVLAPQLAHATTFTWTFAGANISGSGTLVASPDGNPGEYLITSGSGTIDITGDPALKVTIDPCAPAGNVCTIQNSDLQGGNISWDDLLYPANAPGSQLTNNGVVFVPGPPPTLGINIWDGPSQEFYDYYSPTGYENLSTPFTVAATPEPTTLMLLGSGIASLPFFRRRRK